MEALCLITLTLSLVTKNQRSQSFFSSTSTTHPVAKNSFKNVIYTTQILKPEILQIEFEMVIIGCFSVVNSYIEFQTLISSLLKNLVVKLPWKRGSSGGRRKASTLIGRMHFKLGQEGPKKICPMISAALLGVALKKEYILEVLKKVSTY